MKPASSKRMIRIEKKKKKMAAYLEISKLNELDRAAKNIQVTKICSVVDTLLKDTEPSPKRLRTDCLKNKEECYIEPTNIVHSCTDKALGASGKPVVEGEDFLQLKKLLQEHRKKMRAEPGFRLREFGVNASVSTEAEDRVPLFLTDIQHLIMYSQIGHHSPYSPARWCQLEKYTRVQQTTVLVIENITLEHFIMHQSLMPFLSSIFTHKLEIITPQAYNGDIIQELATVALTSTQMRNYVSKFGDLETAVKHSDLYDRIRNLFPVKENEESVQECFNGDKFPRTHLLLSGWQMVEENFPLPIKNLMETKYTGYVLSKDSYAEVTPYSPMFGVDCEMCLTTARDGELTRISVVNENFESIYDELVKPDNKIVDYLTKFSGITAKMMRNVTKRLQEVQEDLRKLLPADAILVGQSLSNDMHALKMMHPYVIDTSVIYNITGDRTRKTKLQTLSREFLSERIQEGHGHCSVEDSVASLKLAKLKLKNSIYFGDAVMENVSMHIKQHPELGHPHYATSLLKQTTKLEKTALVVGLDDVAAKYNYFTNKDQPTKVNKRKINFVSEKSNKAVIFKMCEILKGYTLNISHIRLTSNQLANDNTKTFKNIDKWVKQLYDATMGPGLVIVVFGGNTFLGNGACFITLKRSQ